MTANTAARHRRPAKPAQALWFEDVAIELVELNGTTWIRRRDALRALGYRRPEKGGTFLRWRQHFTDDLAIKAIVKTSGGPQSTWLFNASGAQLMCMLARTERSAAFRLWLIQQMGRVHSSLCPASARGTNETRAGDHP